MNKNRKQAESFMPLTSLIRKRDSETPRAKMKTFGAIVKKYNGFPPLRDENGEMAYDVIIDVFHMLALDEDPEITLEEVEAGLTMEKIPEVMRLITEKFKINIPDELAAQIAEETGIKSPVEIVPEKLADKKEIKN